MDDDFERIAITLQLLRAVKNIKYSPRLIGFNYDQRTGTDPTTQIPLPEGFHVTPNWFNGDFSLWKVTRFDQMPFVPEEFYTKQTKEEVRTYIDEYEHMHSGGIVKPPLEDIYKIAKTIDWETAPATKIDFTKIRTTPDEGVLPVVYGKTLARWDIDMTPKTIKKKKWYQW